MAFSGASTSMVTGKSVNRNELKRGGFWDQVEEVRRQTERERERESPFTMSGSLSLKGTVCDVTVIAT